ncbi:BACON domain-containing protein [Porphyromonas bennonis]|uniref:BACON domain-containing protein n=1 Tax=Porphyromonas bennonis TaxID=501496 RepID=UPI000366E851|nr:BACON domain-containing protein [Porphyromonas bennonis]
MKPLYTRYVASLGALLLLALSLVGCRDTLLDRTQPDPTAPEQIGDDVTDRLDGAVTVSLSYDTPALRTPQTRAALSVDQESELKLATTRVMIFDSNDVYQYDAPLTKIERSTKDMQEGNLIVQIKPGKGLGIVVLANLTEKEKGREVSGKKDEILKTFEFSMDQTTDFSSVGIPMFGEVTQVEVKTDTQPVPKLDKTIHLLRAVARVDVGLNMSAVGTSGKDSDFDETASDLISTIVDPANKSSKKVKWTLLETKFYNASSKGLVAPAKDNYKLDGDKLKATAPTLLTNPDKQDLTYKADKAEKNLLKRVIYVPETDNPAATQSGTETTPEAKKQYLERPYLILKLQYDEVDESDKIKTGGASGETFFRVDFLKREGDEATAKYTYLPLLRNYRYKVDIRNIGGLGFDSEDEAKEGPAANIMYNVVVWDESTLSNVVYDGQYMLGVQNDKLLFHKNGGTFSTKVQTSWPGGFKVEGLPDWVTVKSTEPSDPDATGEKIVTFEVTESTTTKRDFSGAYIQAGRMRWNLDITQLNTLDLRIAIFSDLECTKPLQYIELDERGKETPDNDYTVGKMKFYVRVTPAARISAVNDETKAPFIFKGAAATSPSRPPIETAKEVSTGVYEFEVTADPLSNPKNPFETRQNKYHFITEQSGEKAEATLAISQTEYNIVFYEDEELTNPMISEGDAATYFMDGTDKQFYVRSNIPYIIWMDNQMIDESARSRENANADGSSKFPMVTGYYDKDGTFVLLDYEDYDPNNSTNNWRRVKTEEAPTPNGSPLKFKAAETDALKIIYGHVMWVACTTMKSLEWKFPLYDKQQANHKEVTKIQTNFVAGYFLPEANCYPLTLGYSGVLIPLSRINHAADFYERYMDAPANFGKSDYVISDDHNACIGSESWETYKKRNSLNRLDEDDDIDVEVLWTDIKSVTERESAADRNPVKADGTAPLRLLTDLQLAGERYIFLMPGKDGSENYGNLVVAVRSTKKKKVDNNRSIILDPDEKNKKTILWSFHLMLYRPASIAPNGTGIPKNNGFESTISNGSVTFYDKTKTNDKEYSDYWYPDIYSWPYDLGAFKMPEGWDNTLLGVTNDDSGRRDLDYRAIGMSYQFGRKDPFPRWHGAKTPPSRFVGDNGKEVSFKLHKNTTISMRESIENPMVVVGSGRGEQWLTEGGKGTASNIGFLGSASFPYYGLWGGGAAVGNENNANKTRLSVNRSTDKTVFDPTPYGFSVPAPGYSSTKVLNDSRYNVERFRPNFARHFVNTEYRLISEKNARYVTIFGVTNKTPLSSGGGEQGWAVSTTYIAQAHYPIFTLKPGNAGFQQRYADYCNRSAPIALRPFNNLKESDWETYIRR